MLDLEKGIFDEESIVLPPSGLQVTEISNDLQPAVSLRAYDDN